MVTVGHDPQSSSSFDSTSSRSNDDNLFNEGGETDHIRLNSMNNNNNMAQFIEYLPLISSILERILARTNDNNRNNNNNNELIEHLINNQQQQISSNITAAAMNSLSSMLRMKIDYDNYHFERMNLLNQQINNQNKQIQHKQQSLIMNLYSLIIILSIIVISILIYSTITLNNVESVNRLQRSMDRKFFHLKQQIINHRSSPSSSTASNHYRRSFKSNKHLMDMINDYEHLNDENYENIHAKYHLMDEFHIDDDDNDDIFNDNFDFDDDSFDLFKDIRNKRRKITDLEQLKLKLIRFIENELSKSSSSSSAKQQQNPAKRKIFEF